MSSNVTFEGEESSNNVVGNIQIVPGAPTGMLAWLVKNKVVENAKQAEMFLLGIAICAIILAIGIFIFSGHTQSISQNQLNLTKNEHIPTTAP